MTFRHALAVVLLAFVACKSQEDVPVAHPETGSVVVGLVLGDDGLTATWVGSSAATTNEAPETFDATLRWELRDGERVVATGDARDPRLHRGEVLVSGALAPIAKRTSGGAMTVIVPNVGGTLALLDGTRELGRTSLPISSAEGTRTVRPRAFGDQEAAPVAIANGGPCALLSLMVMPEGFTEAEMGSFHAKADALVRGLASVPGFDEASRFEAYRADLASRQSGLSDRGDERDTAWNVRYGTPPDDRRSIGWTAPNASADAAFRRALAAAKLSMRTVLVVLVNSSEPLGSSDRGARTVILAASPDASRTLAHELGHVLAGLADEYDYGACTLATAGLAPNTTKDRSAPPWAAILSTPPVEGADYCARGVYRPQATCLMRSLDHDLCPVCRAKLDAFFAKRRAEKPAACQKPDCTGPICLSDGDCNTAAGEVCVPSSGKGDGGQLFACVKNGEACRD